MKKKLLILITILALALTAMTACGDSQKETPKEPESVAADPVDVRVMALKGPTAMGMVQMMDQNDQGKLTDNRYTFTIAAAPDEVTAAVGKGEVDIAAVPANLASVLYNNLEGNVQVVAVNTLGVLYLCENGDSVQSVEDLRGKTIYASGKGATPEYALNYVLTENGIDPAADVTIEWKAEHAECLSALLADPNGVALLPQPFVTSAQTQQPSVQVALDLNDAWNAIQKEKGEDSSLLTGVLIVRKEFAEANPQAVEVFLANYQTSVDFVNENVADVW